MNQDYLRRTSARHLPSGVSVTFRRDERAKRYATLCFANLDNCLPWNDAIAEEWLAELFLNDRPRVREIAAATEDAAVRHFQLAC
jgi:hypothetical protein